MRRGEGDKVRTQPVGSVREAMRWLLADAEKGVSRQRYKVLPTGQLAAAEAPSGNRRLYRYEDPGFPFALTAIEVESGGR